MTDKSGKLPEKRTNAQESTYGENRTPASTKRPAPEKEKPDAQSTMTGDTAHKHTNQKG
ncbi:MAG: hypothetical protein LIP28_08275 [Deltaproteobacteria bacterium]|nr:hypothetical protein [Deltaproteobacteria bacterium]